MAEQPIPEQELLNRVYKGPSKTGDNVNALVTMGYTWDGTGWNRPATSFVDKAYDTVNFSNADANGNYQTIVFSANSSAVRTLTLTFDASSNVTSIARA